MLIVAYAHGIQAIYAYAGYGEIVSTPGYWIFAGCGLAFIALLLPAEIVRPSDLFLTFYLVIVAVASVLFGNIAWVGTLGDNALAFMILVFPAMAMILARQLPIRLPTVAVLSPSVAYWGLALLILLAATVAIVKGGGIGGFGWSDMYARRLAGREIFVARSAEAYLFAICANGVAPFVGYAGGFYRSRLMLLIAVVFGVAAFWALGLKAPLAITVMFYALGYLLRVDRLRDAPRFLLVALCGLAGLSIIAVLAFDSVLVGGMTVRRMFATQGMLQAYYFDFIASAAALSVQDLVFGPAQDWPRGITYHIGAVYAGNPETNANTSAFLLAFAERGLFGYIVAIAFTVTFFWVLDRAYERSLRPELYAVAALYGVLLAEQGFTTAFVSSGIFLVSGVALIMGKRDRSEAHRNA